VKYVQHIIWAALLLAGPVFAVDGKLIDTSSTNLSATYTTSFPQLTLSGFYYKAHLKISNATAKWICCQMETPSTTVAPTAGDGHEQCVAPNSVEIYDVINLQRNVYCRSGGTALTTGLFAVAVW
jgi:hypothetical protein